MNKWIGDFKKNATNLFARKNTPALADQKLENVDKLITENSNSENAWDAKRATQIMSRCFVYFYLHPERRRWKINFPLHMKRSVKTSNEAARWEEKKMRKLSKMTVVTVAIYVPRCSVNNKCNIIISFIALRLLLKMSWKNSAQAKWSLLHETWSNEAKIIIARTHTHTQQLTLIMMQSRL